MLERFRNNDLRQWSLMADSDGESKECAKAKKRKRRRNAHSQYMLMLRSNMLMETIQQSSRNEADPRQGQTLYLEDKGGFEGAAAMGSLSCLNRMKPYYAVSCHGSAALSYKPEPTSCIPLLEKCSDREQAKQIHIRMIKTGLVRIKPFPNPTHSCGTPSSELSPSQNQEQSILLYCQMLDNAAPHNLHTFPFPIKACTLEEIHQIHCHVIKFGFASEIYTLNALLHAYAKFGCIASASSLFRRMPLRDPYAKSEQIDIAKRLFDMMEEKNVISWTVMINGYVEIFLFKDALELFQEKQERRVEPDNVALACALSACAHLDALEQGRWVHTYIRRKKVELDKVLGRVLVDMYAKCGELDEAVITFNKIVETRCVSLWTAIITGFAIHGQGR
ncbi:uncharacterized protein A4U43_C01F36140 [Asparagus officinalis]|uniref:Pentatricopeptide repeat-containing protein n=1 Tax=Asparagus officinalis TaxID=4686 RepID=A0A5P1FW78_ASPOF|nr:uncharacterized protein A4U43_C01F36140 [Asparagus officinalis]